MTPQQDVRTGHTLTRRTVRFNDQLYVLVPESCPFQLLFDGPKSWLFAPEDVDFTGERPSPREGVMPQAVVVYERDGIIVSVDEEGSWRHGERLGMVGDLIVEADIVGPQRAQQEVIA